MQLRPRQKVFVEKSIAALDKHGNTLGVAPTGAGKTVMLSAIVGSYIDQGAKALVIQHRDELVKQNSATFQRMNPRRIPGLFTAKIKEWHQPCTFAMVQTLASERNLDAMPAVDLITVDEGHHSAAPSYLRLFDAAKKKNPNVRLHLVTATPNRGDKKALRGIVDNVADKISLRELIDARLLVPPRSLVLDIGVRGELAGVKKTMSDFDMTAVEAIMDKEVLRDRIVEEWGNIASDRQTVVFCSTVKHAQHVAETFRAAGVRAATVEGNMSEQDRTATLAAYDRGDIQVLTNVAVLTEGWDHQPTSCVILLRPSSYFSTMAQMIGRGLRKVDPERYPGVTKTDCIVMDFGTSILMHGSLEQEADLDQAGVKNCPECEATMPAQCRECAICGYEFPRPEPEESVDPPGEGEGDGKPGKAELSDFILTEVDLLNDSPYRYETLFDGAVSIASGFDAWAVVVNYYGGWHAIGGKTGCPVKHLAAGVDRLMAMASADDHLREHGDSEGANKTKRWLSQPPSEKQLAHLGLNPLTSMGLTRYRATCLLQWKFSEKAIKAVLERSTRMAA